MNNVKAITRCLKALDAGVPALKRVTLYLSPTLTVKVTRSRRPLKRDMQATVVVTVGRPNYTEVRFIKLCKKAGEPFPVKKLQLKAWPIKRAKRAAKLAAKPRAKR